MMGPRPAVQADNAGPVRPASGRNQDPEAEFEAELPEPFERVPSGESLRRDLSPERDGERVREDDETSNASMADTSSIDLDMIENAILQKTAKIGALAKPGKDHDSHHHKKNWIVGVFIPTCENMWGVLIFLRFFEIVGHAGVVMSLVAVFISFLAAIVTAVSLAAVAGSGGFVSKGGPYYMISRSLGPYLGASIGIMYWLGNTILGTMECIGAVEAFLMAVPESNLTPYVSPGDEATGLYATLCLYGIAIVLTLVFFVWGGISIVTKLGVVFATIVAATLGLFYAGLYLAEPKGGDSGMTGLSAETLQANMGSKFSDEYHFGTAMSIFFPCFTGILSGADRADVLRDPSNDIRKGTYAAIIFSLFMYSSFMVLWGAVATQDYLIYGDVDPYADAAGSGGSGSGGSGGHRLLLANIRRLAGGGSATHIFDDIINWPNTLLPQLGVMLASISQALQCFVVAPRLLQQIAKDNLLPVLAPIAPLNKGEPVRALFVTCICACLLALTGSIGTLATLLTMCFLTCYTTLNFSCFVLTVLRSPTWRPPGVGTRTGFTYYSGAGLLGSVLCVGVMLRVSPMYAAITIGLTVALFQYIQMQGGTADWGSGLDGIRFNLALSSVLALERQAAHKVNWRPQVLVLYKIHVAGELHGTKHHEIIEFYSQLRHSKGMCIVAAVLEGDPGVAEDLMKAQMEKELIKAILVEEDVLGFAEVVVSPDWGTGTNYILQLTGLGGLKPNTVMLSWPTGWRKKVDRARDFVNVMCTATNEDMCVVVGKEFINFPRSGTPTLHGTIDIWYVMHDGGILVMLAWLLQQDDIWKKCQVRVYCVLENVSDDDAEDIAKALRKLIAGQRFGDSITVEVIVLDGLQLEPYSIDVGMSLTKSIHASVHNSAGTNTIPLRFPSWRDSKSQDLESQITSEKRNSKAALAKIDDLIKTKTRRETRKSVVMKSMSSNFGEIPTVRRMSGVLAHIDHRHNPEDDHIDKVTRAKEIDLLAGIHNRLHPETRRASDDNGDPMSPSTASSAKNTQSNQSRKQDAKQTARATRLRQSQSASSPYAAMNKKILEESKRAQLVLMNLPDVWDTSETGAVQYLSYCESITQGLDRIVFVHSAGTEALDFHL